MLPAGEDPRRTSEDRLPGTSWIVRQAQAARLPLLRKSSKRLARHRRNNRTGTAPAAVAEKERAARPDDQAARDCGGFFYHTTWGAEGSQTRRSTACNCYSRTTVGGVVPACCSNCMQYCDSGAETAFLATLDEPDARAAQRRPGAGHRARPGPPQLPPQAKTKTLYHPQTRPASVARRRDGKPIGGGWVVCYSHGESPPARR
jgi:hypothetical protein